jgi:FADH2 O2-dependent halogenase
MLPSAAGFVDPLLSTGFPLTLLGVKRIAELLEAYWQTTHFEQALRDYAEATDAEFLQTANLIAALYANMNNFPVFRALSLLYFAAASYSETVKRLGKPHLAKSFLLHDLPSFGPASGRLFAKAAEGIPTTDTVAFIREVKAIIEPIDVAGLTKSHARHHYPVDANDLLANAWKVDSNREEIVQMLERSGFYATTTA